MGRSWIRLNRCRYPQFSLAMASFLSRAVFNVANVARQSSLSSIRSAHTTTIYTYLNYRDRFAYVGEREVTPSFSSLSEYKAYLDGMKGEDYQAAASMQIQQLGTEMDPIPAPARAGPFPAKVFLKELAELEARHTGKDAESTILKEINAKWTDEMSFGHSHEDGLLYGVVAVRANKKVDQEDLSHFMADQTAAERLAGQHQCIQELYMAKPEWNKY